MDGAATLGVISTGKQLAGLQVHQVEDER